MGTVKTAENRALMHNSDRDENGRFVNGSAGGPGRPRRMAEGRLFRQLADAVDDDSFGEIVRKAVAQAKAGDRHARSFIMAYLMGTPIKRQFVQIESEELLPNLDALSTAELEILDRLMTKALYHNVATDQQSETLNERLKKKIGYEPPNQD